MRPDGETDITSVFGTDGPGSIPGRGTYERSEGCSPEARLGAVRPGIEDLASILWSEANRKSARCTDPVRVDKRNRGPGRGTKTKDLEILC